MTDLHRRPRAVRRLALALLVPLAATSVVACGDDGSDDADGPVTVRLLTHESFAVGDGVLERFEEESGIHVELVQGGDAGTVVNQAILTNGNPQADVLFGIDSTLLTRALDEDLFVPYESPELAEVDPAYALDEGHRVTPVDYGDVCLNYDKAWFAEHELAVPTTLEQLVEPAYRDLLVVENPATSSPGLAFLLASVDHFGEDGWEAWWSALRDNGVVVTDGWDDAYYGRFSGGATSEGDRPLVVSYASSPPAEVIFAEPAIDEAPTGVIAAGCYRQVEGAGILQGSDHVEEAQELIDFLLSEAFQADVPTSMFVYPVRRGVELPEAFVAHAVQPDQVAELAPDVVAEHRADWTDTWTDLVLR